MTQPTLSSKEGVEKLTVCVTKKQKEFLEQIIFEDAASSIGGAKGELGNAVQWCIDSCEKIEKKYHIDACYVAHNDDFWLDLLRGIDDTALTLYNIKFYDEPKLFQVRATNFTTAGIIASAYRYYENKGVGWGIEWIESDKTHNKVPFDIKD